jgi:hypothetical protein
LIKNNEDVVLLTQTLYCSGTPTCDQPKFEDRDDKSRQKNCLYMSKYEIVANPADLLKQNPGTFFLKKTH